jgi:streptogramin lyase
MNKKNSFDMNNLKGKLSRLRDWMKAHHFPPKLLFFLMGIISTIWFLVRVIPKPSRAGYPCMRVAAPIMSGFVVYLLSIGGITFAIKKIRQNLYKARYFAAGTFLLAALAGSVILILNTTQNTFARTPSANGPDDGPNQPIGKALGVNPGRVVWIWNPEATNENCKTGFETQDWYWKPENTNDKVVGNMFRDALNKLGGKPTVSESWDVLFRYQNNKKHHSNKGYTKGEKIFIKINQGTARWLLTQEDKNNGYFYPTTLKLDEVRRRTSMGPTETGPYIVLEILRELVNELGINQADIAVGDPMTDTYGHNYNIWFAEFPRVLYTDKFSSTYGRTLIVPTEKDVIFYSDKSQSDKIYDIVEKADYLINVANLKPHLSAGISLTAKNHFGSVARPSAGHLHYSLVGQRNQPTNGGYHKYRVQVDLMGSKYLGQNTLLYLVDGLFGGGSSETKGPVKYFMPPFNNDWCNSIFLSLDQVALESVCYDFLRTEWNGINNHNASNNAIENNPNWNGVDDYLHQAADSSNWPAGIIYDPDNSGKPISSMGVHEHWNDLLKKQYSRNLGSGNGIELISIPDTLVAKRVPGNKTNLTSRSFGEGFTAKTFYSAVVDDENTKWFLTESGIVSFDGKKWVMHNRNRKVPNENLKDLAFDVSDYGRELWIASPQGATVSTLPVDARSGATTYYSENSSIPSDNVLAIAIGKSPLRWFGTDKGVSAFYNKKWLKNSYQRKYPAELFTDFPITAMAASPDGDSLYVATDGGGVSRFFRNDVDGISGASEYAQWGPIEMPSDKVHSVCILPDGTQWFGTDSGAARHIGYNTLKNWTVFNKSNGLIDNYVQAIACDKKGRLWFGTKAGVSVYDGSTWISHTQYDGLCSNNVLCIAVDRDGVVWTGTDKGVTSFKDGIFINYN